MKAGEEGVEDMVASLSQSGDERWMAGHDFAAFEEDHDDDPQKRYVENCNEGVHSRAPAGRPAFSFPAP